MSITGDKQHPFKVGVAVVDMMTGTIFVFREKISDQLFFSAVFFVFFSAYLKHRTIFNRCNSISAFAPRKNIRKKRSIH